MPTDFDTSQIPDLLPHTFAMVITDDSRFFLPAFGAPPSLLSARSIYISMVLAESQRPIIFIKVAFKTVSYRFCIFFVFGVLTVSIVCAYNGPTLVKIWFGNGSSGSAAASPFVVAMQNIGIAGLPHLIKFLLLTSIFSAGNTYTYAATRVLYSLALEGHAPKFLRYCNKNGIPIWCFCVVMCFLFLSFLQVSNGSAAVLTWLTSIITGGALITFMIMSITFINYYKACQAQVADRRTERPYYGYFQPYCAIISLAVQGVILLMYGYYAFRSSGMWRHSSKTIPCRSSLFCCFVDGR